MVIKICSLANILVYEEDEPKLFDFGLRSSLTLLSRSCRDNNTSAHPGLRKPEQVAGGPITTATDIYSVRAVL